MKLGDIRQGSKAAVAKALAAIEASSDRTETCSLLDEAYAKPLGRVIGLTGPPGVGKSTLIDRLIHDIRGRDKTIAVIAVDPSSRVSGGALLGDRTRFTTDPEDPGIFIRSMAARTRLGGIADLTYPASVLMRALYDVVIVETVGVGQSETQVTQVADLVVFCAQPGSGDALQFMKAGIMEVPDLVLVTKSDLGPLARQTMTDLRGALSLLATETPPALMQCSANRAEGVAEVVEWLLETREGQRPSNGRHEAQLRAWITGQIQERFGRAGLSASQDHRLSLSKTPFSELETMLATLQIRFDDAFAQH
ncbi:MAG: methylmalonyl Co-A mutase-associated GTPase MeaB [Pseudomonadota bacterium]